MEQCVFFLQVINFARLDRQIVRGLRTMSLLWTPVNVAPWHSERAAVIDEVLRTMHAHPVNIEWTRFQYRDDAVHMLPSHVPSFAEEFSDNVARIVTLAANDRRTPHPRVLILSDSTFDDPWDANLTIATTANDGQTWVACSLGLRRREWIFGPVR